MNTEIDINRKYVSEQEITDAIGGTGNNGAEKIKNAFVTKNQSKDDEGKFLKVDNGRVRCKDVTIPSAYKHPTFSADTNELNGLYKITVDAEGHVTETNAVTGNDLPDIPQAKIDLSGVKLTDLDKKGFTLSYSSITNPPTKLTQFSPENFKINVNNVITNDGTSIKLSNMNQDGFSITNGMIPTKTITLDKINSSAYTTTLDNSEKLITNKAVSNAISGLESNLNTHGHGSITNDGQISATTNNVTRILVTDNNTIKSTTRLPSNKVDIYRWYSYTNSSLNPLNKNGFKGKITFKYCPQIQLARMYVHITEAPFSGEGNKVVINIGGNDNEYSTNRLISTSLRPIAEERFIVRDLGNNDDGALATASFQQDGTFSITNFKGNPNYLHGVLLYQYGDSNNLIYDSFYGLNGAESLHDISP